MEYAFYFGMSISIEFLNEHKTLMIGLSILDSVYGRYILTTVQKFHIELSIGNSFFQVLFTAEISHFFVY